MGGGAQCNVKPRTIFCHDNLPVLRCINSNCIDLIYLDPPFNKGKQFHAPTGTSAEGASFDDIWKPSSVKDEVHNELNDSHPELYNLIDMAGKVSEKYTKYYLIYMVIRLLEMRRVLKPTGSIYLHCDPKMSHYLKLAMDAVFGQQNFRNEVVWCYSGGGQSKKDFPKKHDIIFRYSKTNEWTFNQNAVRVPYDSNYKATVFTSDSSRSPGKTYKPNPDGKIVEDWWVGIARPYGKDHQGYPTQKPVPLLKRIIDASSNRGDLILDPFCGCATTCVASELLSRSWIGIDISKKAHELVQKRLNDEVPRDLFHGASIFRKDKPVRTDISHKKRPTIDDKWELYKKQESKCNGCNIQFGIENLEIDHIVPQVHGGTHEIENLQLLCGNCNRVKGKRPMEYLLAKRGKTMEELHLKYA